jgi:hypothetical protein
MDIKTTGMILVGAILIISVFMEAYKKFIRKDKASTLEIRWLALFLSLVATVSCYKGFELPGTESAMVLYFLAIYGIQFFVDMKFIKVLFRWWLRKKGITLKGYKYDE